jgi:hypothetical protein
MTTPQQVLSDEQIEDWIKTLAVHHVWGSVLSHAKSREFARAIESATLAALGGQPVYQFRKQHCADWYDGHPDHEDGGGPYETRTLFALPPAQPVPADPDQCSVCGAQPKTAPAPLDEREAFEAWAKPRWLPLDRCEIGSASYRIVETNLAWCAWQARAALQAPAPQTKGGEA